MLTCSTLMCVFLLEDQTITPIIPSIVSVFSSPAAGHLPSLGTDLKMVLTKLVLTAFIHKPE